DRAQPCGRAWRCLGTAAQTGTEACFGCRRSGRVIPNVRTLRVAHLAYRAAVDSRGSDRNEELAIETGIAAGSRAIERSYIETEDLFHDARIRMSSLVD